MDQVLHDVGFHAWFDSLSRDQVYSAAEQLLQIEFCVHVAVKSGTPAEFDEDIHIAARMVLPASDRSEDRHGLHTQLGQLGAVPANTGNDCPACHELDYTTREKRTYSEDLCKEQPVLAVLKL
jgi:hypothetical protein